MPLQLESSNVFIRGNFNPYIFSPEWLTSQGVWEEQEVHLALGATLGDGIQFRSVNSDIEWSVSSSSLIIATLGDAGTLAASVMEKLPHTPVQAVGCNFVFALASWDSDLVPKLGASSLLDLPSKYHAELVKWTGVFHLDEQRVDMAVACGNEGITVSFNHHRSVGTAEEAGAAAKRFLDNKALSVEMIGEILRETVAK